jgi:hypothetical protein
MSAVERPSGDRHGTQRPRADVDTDLALIDCGEEVNGAPNVEHPHDRGGERCASGECGATISPYAAGSAKAVQWDSTIPLLGQSRREAEE